jgi:hypothetical protein
MAIIEIYNLIRNNTTSIANPILIEYSLFQEENGLAHFNKIIRKRIENRPGIYVWENADSGEILYLGMAGKICQIGEFTNHDIQKRMLATRGKDPVTNKDVQTNSYIKQIMASNNINNLNIHPFLA